MKEHGIIMSAPMVLALLAGRKTVTRRTSDRWAKVSPGDRLWVRETFRLPLSLDGHSLSRIAEMCDEGGYTRPWCPMMFEADKRYNNAVTLDDLESIFRGWSKRARPAIHTPRWASRILLEVVSVTREDGHDEVFRLDLPSVTDAEALAEGIYHDADDPWTDERGVAHPPASGWTWDAAAQTYSTPREAYLALFREINGDAMPDHLWRIEFRRVE